MKRSSLNLTASALVNQKRLIRFIPVLIFVLSVIIRLPNLNRPLDAHHEWLTSTVLRVQRIWYEEGALRHRFLPIMTYGNEADKNIANVAEIRDATGNFYHTSYPPLAYIFPYLVFRLVNIYPDVLPLQILNLALHFISSLLIFLIISLLTKKRYIGSLNMPALLGFTLYLFAPATLWFHSNVYSRDMLVQPLFIAGVYVTAKLIASQDKKPIHYLVLGLTNFLMISTEWLGVFFAFSVFLFALLNIRKREMRIVLCTVAISSIASLTLMIWHYSQISGFDVFVKSSFEKYSYRSGAFQTAESGGFTLWNRRAWQRLAGHYRDGYLPFLVLVYSICVAYLALLKKRLSKDMFLKNRLEIITLYLCMAPVVLHHLVLFNFTSVHDFSVLKAGGLIAIFTPLLYYRLINVIERDNLDENRRTKVAILRSVVILAIIGSILQYVVINRRSHDTYKKIGGEIATIARSDEVVFIRSEDEDYDVFPQIVFYAHRNIALWKSGSSARELLNLNNIDRGIVFVLSEDNTRIVATAHGT
jgi:hypothetical protein